jgi:hypothetical protein
MNNTNLTNFDSFTILLDRTAHLSASKFAAGQMTIAKGRQVYLNTLAVCAVRQYLSFVCQLDLDLTHGDSWQVELQSIMNVADLVIPNVGKIECIPVLANTIEIQIPPETIEERVGYLVVQFNGQIDSVELIGFIPQIQQNLNTLMEPPIVNIAQLQSLDDFIDLIYTSQINNLRKFLAGMLGIGWEPIFQGRGFANDSLIQISPKNAIGIRELRLRGTNNNLSNHYSYNSIRDFNAGKIINLSGNIASIPLLLLIGLNQESDERINVKIRLHSGGSDRLLPANIELGLRSIDNRLLSHVQYSRSMDFIQLPSFKLPPGIEFKIEVVLGNDRFIESFIA